MRAVSSVFIALFLVALSFGTVFALLYATQFQQTPVPTALNLRASYSVSAGYFNITNEGPGLVQVKSIFITEPDGLTTVSTFQATLLPGQKVPIFLGKWLENGSVVAVETAEGVKVVHVR